MTRNFRSILKDRPHQRRIPRFIYSVNICSSLDKKRHHIQTPVPDGFHQCQIAMSIRGVWVRAAIQKQPRNSNHALKSGNMQGIPTNSLCRHIWVRSKIQKQLCGCVHALNFCDRKWNSAILSNLLCEGPFVVNCDIVGFPFDSIVEWCSFTEIRGIQICAVLCQFTDHFWMFSISREMNRHRMATTSRNRFGFCTYFCA